MRVHALTFRSRARAMLLLACALAGGVGIAACGTTRAASATNAETRTGETLELLEDGVRRAGLRAARRNVAAWEARLRSEDVPAFDEIADTLDRLEAELAADAIDRAAVGRLLGRLGKQTRAAARREGAPDRLGQLGARLAQVGGRLQ